MNIMIAVPSRGVNSDGTTLIGLDHKFNTWIPRDELLEKGFTKLVQQFDDLESSREGAGQRDTAAHVVRKHLEDIGLDGDIAQYNEIAGLSGGLRHCFI